MPMDQASTSLMNEVAESDHVRPGGIYLQFAAGETRRLSV